MASAAVRDFCLAAKESVVLKEEAKLRCKSATDQKKASQAILQELLMLATENVGSNGYVSSHDGNAYRVRLCSKSTVAPPKNATSAAERILELWEDQSSLADSIMQNSGLDPADAVIDYVLKHTTRVEQKKDRLEVIPYRPKANEEGSENMPTPAPGGSGIDELVSTYMTAKIEASSIVKESKEKRKSVEERCTDAEERLLSELDALPAGRKMQRVNLRDSEGQAESYYLRIKTAKKKASSPLIGMKNYRSAVKAAVGDVLAKFCVDSYLAPTIVPRPEFGQELSETLRRTVDDVVSQRNSNKAAATLLAPRRVALDRVRGNPSGERSGVQ
jgi:hypothetical protein